MPRRRDDPSYERELREELEQATPEYISAVDQAERDRQEYEKKKNG